MPALSINIGLPTHKLLSGMGTVGFNGIETNRDSLSIVRATRNTPNFNNPKLRPSRQDMPCNPFYYKKERTHALKGTYTYYNYAHPEWDNIYEYYDGTLGDSMFRFGAKQNTSSWFTSGELEAVNQKAIQKLLADIKDQKSNLVLMFAERAQTAEMFAKTAERIADSISAIRRGDFTRAAEAVGIPLLPQRKRKRMNQRYRRDPKSSVSGNWLELQYGWQPLLQDCYGAAELIAQKQARELVASVRSRASIKRDSSWKQTANLHPTQKLYYHDKISYEVRYGVWFSTDDNNVHTMAQIGLLNPATIAWELLPYSFVVDWFIPFGNYVNSWDATVGLSFRKGFCTTFFRGTQNFTLSMNYVHNPCPWEVEIGSGAGSYEKVECRRTPLTSFPRLSFPSFKNPVSKTHLANAIALLRQSFKR